ncbi:MAG TPA: two-component regulator propeller domain-containing protein [Bacteroidota bacterium]|nr:two-component regulator propeller domain-containing protein [Bacteroidota bacterium]
MCTSWNCKSTGSTTAPPGPVWQVFTKANSGLYNNSITRITVAYNGRVWFSTYNGASYFDKQSWGVIKDSLRDDGNPLISPVHDIVDAKDHAVWFCLNDRVVRFAEFSQAHTWTNYIYPFIQPPTVLTGAANRSGQTVYGDVWVAGINGISLFHQGANETGVWSSYYKSDGVTPLPSPDLMVAEYKPDDFSIWFGSKSGGAVQAFYNEGGFLQWSEYQPPRDAGQSIYSIGFADLIGSSITTVWFGRDTDVTVYNIPGASWTTYSPSSTNGKLPHSAINAIATNYARQRWFGTNLGLVKFENDTSWTTWTMANSVLPSDTITALRFDSFHNLWIGTPSGVAVYNPSGVHYQ